mmetsp:Transcript_15738/g.44040  ORF Transcript_15738/g.44040 Transcript_15738/m.44040 type:complete len:266 (+) Transcript_15738:439-1236(+)
MLLFPRLGVALQVRASPSQEVGCRMVYSLFNVNPLLQHLNLCLEVMQDHIVQAMHCAVHSRGLLLIVAALNSRLSFYLLELLLQNSHGFLPLAHLLLMLLFLLLQHLPEISNCCSCFLFALDGLLGIHLLLLLCRDHVEHRWHFPCGLQLAQALPQQHLKLSPLRRNLCHILCDVGVVLQIAAKLFGTLPQFSGNLRHFFLIVPQLGLVGHGAQNVLSTYQLLKALLKLLLLLYHAGDLLPNTLSECLGLHCWVHDHDSDQSQFV